MTRIEEWPICACRYFGCAPASDHQRGVRVAKVVEAGAGLLRAADGGTEDALAEVVVVQDLALRRREDEAEVVRLACEELTAEHAHGPKTRPIPRLVIYQAWSRRARGRGADGTTACGAGPWGAL